MEKIKTEVNASLIFSTVKTLIRIIFMNFWIKLQDQWKKLAAKKTNTKTSS